MSSPLDYERNIEEFLNSKNPAIVGKSPLCISLKDPLDAIKIEFCSSDLPLGDQNRQSSHYCYLKPIQNNASKLVFYRIPEDKSPISLITTYEVKMSTLLWNNSTTAKSDKILSAIQILFDQIPEFQSKFKGKEHEIGILSPIPLQDSSKELDTLLITLLWTIGAYCEMDQQDSSSFSNLPFTPEVVVKIATKNQSVMN